MSAPGSHYVGLFQTFFSCDFIVLFQFAKIYSAQVSLLLTLHTLSIVIQRGRTMASSLQV